MNEIKPIKKNKITNLFKNHHKRYLTIMVICVLTMFLSVSYALFTSFDVENDIVVFNTGNLQMSVSDSGDGLNLTDNLPESDTDGLANATPVSITLTNTSTITIGQYDVKLINEEDSESNIYYNKIKYSISLDNVTYSDPLLLSDNNIIYTGYGLAVNASQTIYIKIWIDEAAGNDILGKVFNGAIDVTLYQKYQSIDVTGIDNIIPVLNAISPSLVAIDENGELYTGAEGQTIREYRYSGPNSEVTNNYISFNNEEEPWRIIGIFPVTNGLEDIGYRMKIIRQTSVSKQYWDETEPYAWSGGTAQQYLANSYTISSPYSDYIEEVDYYLGNVDIGSVAKDYYTQERDTSNIHSANTPGYWTGKVGLMYPSDYAYAASSTYWTTGGSSYATAAYNYDWLYLGSTEWTVSPSAYIDVDAMNVYSSGNVDNYRVYYYTFALRPSLYLTSDIRLSGSGTSEDPFVIS